MKIVDLLEKRVSPKEPEKISRNAFLYMAPRDPEKEFAQCGTCRMYLPGKERCAILGPNLHVPAEASCGLYIHGEPSDEQEAVALYKSKDVGFVKRPVRCENCVSFNENAGTCKLYAMLNKAKPDVFDLDTEVDKYGCCNAQTSA